MSLWTFVQSNRPLLLTLLGLKGLWNLWVTKIRAAQGLANLTRYDPNSVDLFVLALIGNTLFRNSGWKLKLSIFLSWVVDINLKTWHFFWWRVILEHLDFFVFMVVTENHADHLALARHWLLKIAILCIRAIKLIPWLVYLLLVFQFTHAFIPDRLLRHDPVTLRLPNFTGIILIVIAVTVNTTTYIEWFFVGFVVWTIELIPVLYIFLIQDLERTVIFLFLEAALTFENFDVWMHVMIFTVSCIEVSSVLGWVSVGPLGRNRESLHHAVEV